MAVDEASVGDSSSLRRSVERTVEKALSYTQLYSCSLGRRVAFFSLFIVRIFIFAKRLESEASLTVTFIHLKELSLWNYL